MIENHTSSIEKFSSSPCPILLQQTVPHPDQMDMILHLVLRDNLILDNTRLYAIQSDLELSNIDWTSHQEVGSSFARLHGGPRCYQ